MIDYLDYIEILMVILPVSVFFLSIYLLSNKSNLLFYYVLGNFLSILINIVLKGIIQEPRPKEYIENYKAALAHGKKHLFKYGLTFDFFGMPSGHTQMMLFSTVFIYCALHKENIFYLYFLASFIIMVKLILLKDHTIIQVLVGAIIGSIFGYYMYYLARDKITGTITEKKDDHSEDNGFM